MLVFPSFGKGYEAILDHTSLFILLVSRAVFSKTNLNYFLALDNYVCGFIDEKTLNVRRFIKKRKKINIFGSGWRPVIYHAILSFFSCASEFT